jgi:hypothetical protein
MDKPTQTWNEEELRDLILFAQQLRQENDELRSNYILLEAKLRNEEAKVRRLTLLLAQFTNVN